MRTSQNMQPNTTTDAAPTPTLAELLAARAQQRADTERERALRDQRQRDTDRLDALSHAAKWVEEHLSAQIVAALCIKIAVDEAILATDNDDYDPAALAGYITLRARVLTDTSDTQAEEQAEEQDEETEAAEARWLIRLEHYQYRGYYWTLHGPQGYSVILPAVTHQGEQYGARLLDAIAAYPDWLASADERRAASEQREAERKAKTEAEEKRATRRHYAAVEGPGSYDGQRPGLLWTGTHVHVVTLDPRGDDGIMAWEGVLQSVTREWLLLDLDGARRGSAGAQRLIPAARVLEIQPLPDLAPEADRDAK